MSGFEEKEISVSILDARSTEDAVLNFQKSPEFLKTDLAIQLGTLLITFSAAIDELKNSPSPLGEEALEGLATIRSQTGNIVAAINAFDRTFFTDPTSPLHGIPENLEEGLNSLQAQGLPPSVVEIVNG
jgi:hypothetical protein